MKTPLLILLLAYFSCAPKPKVPVMNIRIENGNGSVKIKGLDYAIAGEINRDTTAGIWEILFPVYRMPADTNLKNYQPVQHGKYALTNGAVVFTPDTPFRKNQDYFMRYYRFEGSDVWDMIRGKKRPGIIAYTDLIFKQ